MNRYRHLSPFQIAALACLALLTAGLWLLGFSEAHTAMLLAEGAIGADMERVLKALDSVEAKLKSMGEKADGEMKTLGKVSTDTKTALDTIGNQQRELADRLLQIEQKGTAAPPQSAASETWGAQLVKSKGYEAFAGGHSQKLRVDVKNTLVGSSTTVAPQRRAEVVAGAVQPLTLEGLLPSVPTTAGAIEYTRENVFTNNAAETAEAAQKPESSITFDLINAPVSTVAHWIKISRQLAADNAALKAYVDRRMEYGVNQRVELQLASGNGVGANISGIFKVGNYIAHGWTNASLPATFKKMALIRKIIADAWVAGFPADGILLSPIDWADIEITLLTTAGGQALLTYTEAGVPRLWGLPVAQSVGVPLGQVAVGAFAQGYMIHNREDVTVDMSESDGDNFVQNLVTIRAERRLVLATERPAAVRAGTLTPA